MVQNSLTSVTLLCLCCCVGTYAFPTKVVYNNGEYYGNQKILISTEQPPMNEIAGTPEAHNEHHNHQNHGHKMTFHFGYNVTLLFDFWSIQSKLGMLWSCLVVAGLAATVEILKVVKLDLVIKYYRTRYPSSTDKPGIPKSKLIVKNGLISTIVAIQATLSFLIMLITMSFNVWLFASAILGLFIGQCMVAFKLYLPNHYYDDETCH